MELIITRRRDDRGNPALVLAGSVDLVTRQTMVDAGLSIIAEGAETLTLDMSGVEFIDSTGISALIELGRVAALRDARLVVSPRSARVGRVLEVVGLDEAWAPAAPAGVSAADR